MTDSIRIIKSDYSFDETTLTRYESQGLTLISVNHVVTSEYVQGIGPEAFKHDVVRWIYHFRVSS